MKKYELFITNKLTYSSRKITLCSYSVEMVRKIAEASILTRGEHIQYIYPSQYENKF
jgi:hypothetical protein